MKKIIEITQNKIIEISVTLLLLYVCIEKYGNSFYSTSQDLENHISLASYILSTRDIANIPYMGDYPPLSHYLAAYLAPIFGNLLAAFTKVSIIVTFFIYFIIFKFAEKVNKINILILFILLAASSYFGIGIFGDEVIGNYFFPQLIATLIALFAVKVIIAEDTISNRFNYHLSLFGLLTIGFFVHPTVIVIIFGAFLIKKILVDLFSTKSALYSFSTTLIYALAILTITYCIPYNRMMSALAVHNGWLAFGPFAGYLTLTNAGYAFILIGLFFSLWCCFYFCSRYNKTDILFSYRLTVSSILVSGSAISILHLVLTYFDKSTFYAVKKNFFFNWTFLCMLLSIIIGDFLSSRFSFINSQKFSFKTKCPPILPAILSCLIISIIYRGTPSISVYALDAIGKDCVKLQESIGLNARQKTIVQLPIPNVYNYLLTSSYLNYPNRKVLWDILSGKIESNLRIPPSFNNHSSGGIDFEYIVSSSIDLLPPAPASGIPFNFKGLKIQKNVDYIDEFLMPPAISLGEVIKMNTKKNILLFQSGIANAEPWGIWSDGPNTRLQIQVRNPTDSNILILFIQPFIHGVRSEFEAYAEINGKKKSLGYFSAANAGAQSIEIPFSKNDLDSLNNLTVDFHYTNTMPAFKAAGLNSGDPRQLSFGFVNMSLK